MRKRVARRRVSLAYGLATNFASGGCSEVFGPGKFTTARHSSLSLRRSMKARLVLLLTSELSWSMQLRRRSALRFTVGTTLIHYLTGHCPIAEEAYRLE